jgi:hypothetical protein
MSYEIVTGMSKNKQKNTAGVRKKPQVILVMTDQEREALQRVVDSMSIIPGTPQSTLLHFVFRAGLKALGGLK